MIPIIMDTAFPIILAAVGGTFAERAGTLNIALEGLITLGAFAGFLAAIWSGTVGGYIAAATVGGLAALLPAFVAGRLGANLFIAALALNLTVAGLVPVLSDLVFGTRGVVQSPGPIHEVLVGNQPLAPYIGLVFAPLAGLFYRRTRMGMAVQASGENPELLRLRGGNPARMRYLAILASGVFSGIAGMYLVARLDAFVPNIAAGRGWLALVAIFVGFRRPLGAGIAAVGFSIVDSLTNEAQGRLEVPGTLLLALPYAVTLVAYVVSTVLAARMGRRGEKARPGGRKAPESRPGP